MLQARHGSERSDPCLCFAAQPRPNPVSAPGAARTGGTASRCAAAGPARRPGWVLPRPAQCPTARPPSGKEGRQGGVPGVGRGRRGATTAASSTACTEPSRGRPAPARAAPPPCPAAPPPTHGATYRDHDPVCPVQGAPRQRQRHLGLAGPFGHKEHQSKGGHAQQQEAGPLPQRAEVALVADHFLRAGVGRRMPGGGVMWCPGGCQTTGRGPGRKGLMVGGMLLLACMPCSVAAPLWQGIMCLARTEFWLLRFAGVQPGSPAMCWPRSRSMHQPPCNPESTKAVV